MPEVHEKIRGQMCSVLMKGDRGVTTCEYRMNAMLCKTQTPQHQTPFSDLFCLDYLFFRVRKEPYYKKQHHYKAGLFCFRTRRKINTLPLPFRYQGHSISLWCVSASLGQPELIPRAMEQPGGPASKNRNRFVTGSHLARAQAETQAHRLQ